MIRFLLKRKIHGATVTGASVDDDEARRYRPRVVVVDDDDRPVEP